MSYGKLAVIKTIGERPVFVILDREDNPATIIPDVNNWLMERLGRTISFTLSDVYWQLCDQEERKKA